MENSMIEVKDFRKTYGNYVAVDGISFDVKKAKYLVCSVPMARERPAHWNAWKDCALRTADRCGWQASTRPASSRKLRNLIGVQLQSAGLPESITPDEAMKFFCAYHNVAPRFDLLERLGLAEKRNTQFFELSAGQQRRLALALAVAHNPQVLFLDEPTAGLDVATRVELHGMMRELQAGGTTIILATHDMAEAEQMSDRVAILLQRKIVNIGTSDGDHGHRRGPDQDFRADTSIQLCLPLDVAFPAVSQHTFKDEYNIYFSSDIGPTVSAIIAHIASPGDTLIDLRVERPSLEDRFLEITNSGVAQ